MRIKDEKKTLTVFYFFCQEFVFPPYLNARKPQKCRMLVCCKHVKSHDLLDVGQTHTHTSLQKESNMCKREREIHLPCGCISPEIGKLPCEPVVDLVESQLSVWRLQDGLKVWREDKKTSRQRRGRRRDEAENRRDSRDV